MKKMLVLLLTIILILMVVPVFASAGGAIAPEAQGDYSFAFWAFILGAISAISLLLGSILGLVWNPSPKVTAGFTAFGGGALLAALSVELIAPTVMEFTQHSGAAGSGHEKNLEFIFLLGGCVLGGLIFYFLNEALDSKGGYLRKVSTTISYFSRKKNIRHIQQYKQLVKMPMFASVPKKQLERLAERLRYKEIPKGKTLWQKGEYSERVVIIDSGALMATADTIEARVLSTGSLAGESSLISRQRAKYDALAQTNLFVYELSDKHFASLKDYCPAFLKIIKKEAQKEPLGLTEAQANDAKYEKDWAKAALKNQTHTGAHMPSQAEINKEAKEGSAPMSIWLGIFLDGIPESFVIGSGFLVLLSAKLSAGAVTFFDVVPYTLVAGLFLSNLPEAMSSSIGMKKMGWKPLKILGLWGSLVILTAVGAAVGYFYGAKLPNYLTIGIEGVAAGAMLTMIAQTMIPEAVHIGGNRVTGLSTLAGFLSAVAFKILE